MNFNKFQIEVSRIKDIDLPGETSQFKMSPPFRKDLVDANREKMKYAKKAGVMALFYPENDLTYLMLILRKTYKGVHSAQVGFPGGRVEEGDLNMEHTALRETYEEIGVPQDSIEVLKAMSLMYIPPSNFTVHPFIGIAKRTPNFIKQDTEVEDLIAVRLSDLLEDKFVSDVKVMTSLKTELEVPAFVLNGHVVWGATAMMLSELKDLLKMVL